MSGVTPGHAVGDGECVAGHTKRITTNNRGKRCSVTYLEYPAELPTRRDPPQNARNAFGLWDVPGVAGYKIMGDIEIRGTTSSSLIEEKHRREAIQELIAVGRAGTSVLASAIRVRDLRLEAVTHPLRNLEFEGVKNRVRTPSDVRDAAKVCIDWSCGCAGRAAG